MNDELRDQILRLVVDKGFTVADIRFMLDVEASVDVAEFVRSLAMAGLVRRVRGATNSTVYTITEAGRKLIE